MARDCRKNRQCCLKIEKDDCPDKVLWRERKILMHLNHKKMAGIPKYYRSGKNGSSDLICIEALGPSIKDLLTFCGGSFTVKTTLMLGKQMLKRLEDLHSNSFVHQDLKPGNTTIGLGANTSQIYLIDFGISELFENPNTRSHCPPRRVEYFTGTLRYASINAHKLKSQSRRDDLESLAYLLLHTCREGGLTWCPSRHSRKRILKKKQLEDEDSLCTGNVPKQLG